MDKLERQVRTRLWQSKVDWKGVLPELKENAIQLIVQKEKDSDTIEALLDNLLDFRNNESGRKAFVQLLDYYKTINPEAAAYFWDLLERCGKE